MKSCTPNTEESIPFNDYGVDTGPTDNYERDRIGSKGRPRKHGPGVIEIDALHDLVRGGNEDEALHPAILYKVVSSDERREHSFSVTLASALMSAVVHSVGHDDR